MVDDRSPVAWLMLAALLGLICGLVFVEGRREPGRTVTDMTVCCAVPLDDSKLADEDPPTTLRAAP